MSIFRVKLHLTDSDVVLFNRCPQGVQLAMTNTPGWQVTSGVLISKPAMFEIVGSCFSFSPFFGRVFTQVIKCFSSLSLSSHWISSNVFWVDCLSIVKNHPHLLSLRHLKSNCSKSKRRRKRKKRFIIVSIVEWETIPRSSPKCGLEMSTTSVSGIPQLFFYSLPVIYFWMPYISGLDGSTSATDRDRLIRRFNDPNNPVKLFLVSTR